MILPFDFSRAVKGLPQKLVPVELTFNDDIPREFFSTDGVRLVTAMPNLMKKPGVVSLFHWLKLSSND